MTTKTCTVCQTSKELSQFYASSCGGRYGRMAVCKECCKLRASTPEARAKALVIARKHRQKEGYKEKHASYRKTPRAMFCRYQESAEKKRLKFTLTLRVLTQNFWKKPCHYCGDPIDTVGIDRVNGSKGYVKGNMVPCCPVCNYMKRTLSLEAFLQHCLKVASFKDPYLATAESPVREVATNRHPFRDNSSSENPRPLSIHLKG